MENRERGEGGKKSQLIIDFSSMLSPETDLAFNP